MTYKTAYYIFTMIDDKVLYLDPQTGLTSNIRHESYLLESGKVASQLARKFSRKGKTFIYRAVELPDNPF